MSGTFKQEQDYICCMSLDCKTLEFSLFRLKNYKEMDPQIRNFKDFLQLYNKITELCFSHCVDNFFNREIGRDETVCLDKCVQKFTKVNQRIMNVYVEVQTSINARRLAELEAQTESQQQSAIPTIESQPVVPESATTIQTSAVNLSQDTDTATR